MTEKDRALHAVAKAKHRRDEQIARARQDFLDALHRARAAGATLQEIADVLGMSHVAVRKFLQREPD